MLFLPGFLPLDPNGLQIRTIDMFPHPNEKNRVMSDHTIPLAKFVKAYGTPGVYPVPVEEMIRRAGVAIRTHTNARRNGVCMCEERGGLRMDVYYARHGTIAAPGMRSMIAWVFGLWLVRPAAPKWETYEDAATINHNDPDHIFAFRFAMNLLVPLDALAEFIRPLMPGPSNAIALQAAAHFNTPLLYVIQQINRLKQRSETGGA